MTGYENREELLAVDIPTAFYANSSDREKAQETLAAARHVADFESKCAARTAKHAQCWSLPSLSGTPRANVTAYQGFLLDITERKQAESEIRRRNRELLVLNSIARH